MWMLQDRGRSYGRFRDRLYDELDPDFRPLRFEGANVIISLSTRSEDTLLIHSSILEHSPYFKTGLSYRWSTSGKQISTDSQIPVNETIVHKYGLVLDADKDGYTLVGNSPPDEDPISQKEEAANLHIHTQQCWLRLDRCPEFTAHRTVDFHRSSYCQSMPSDAVLPAPSPLFLSQAHRHAVRDHKILFAMLYQINVNLDGLAGEELITCLANVAAYAEYYGLLPFVAKYLEYGLHHCNADMHWQTLHEPTYWLALGYMLRSESIFADALRHFAGGPWIHSFAKYSPEWLDIILLTYKKQLELAKRISLTDHELRRLMLVPEHQGPHVLGDPARFIFLSEDRKAKKIKSEEAKARYLARMTLSDWMADNFSIPPWRSKGVPREAMYPKLLRLATSGDISIFGTEAPSRLTSIFNLRVGQSRRPPQQVIEMEMRRALGEVKAVLERYMFPKHCPPAQLELREEGERIDRDDKRQYYLTHMSVESDEMPWVNEEPWGPIKPDFELRPASEAWLGQVGLGYLKSDVDGVTVDGGVAFAAYLMFDPSKPQERRNNDW